MKIVIAGGSGLLGQALAEALVQADHQVVVLTRRPEALAWQVPGSLLAAWSPDGQGGWTQHIDGSDLVINLAGASIAGDNPLQMRWTPARKRAILESRLLSGAALTQAIAGAKSKPAALIQASAIGYYGSRTALNLNEAAAAGLDFLADVSRQWEASTAAVEGMGLRRVLLRTGLVLSRHGGLLPTLMLPFRLGAGGPIGTGRQPMSWIHIHDWVQAVVHLAASSEARGAYNLTAPQPVDNRTFAKRLGAAIKRPAWLRTPALALKLALGEAATLALDGQHVLPHRLQEAGFRFSFPTIDAALADLFAGPLRFRRSFLVRAGQPAVSAYHRNTAVLRRLTPFPIIVQFQHVEPVRAGSTAQFTLWFGPIPVRWNARHYEVDPQHGFTDDLAQGPFVSWVHRHSFLPADRGRTRVQDEIHAELGRGGFNWWVSRFMWLTLPILFAFRAWRTRRDVEAAHRFTRLDESKAEHV